MTQKVETSFIQSIENDDTLNYGEKATLIEKLKDINKNTKINILITGATGSGKSSTINALFNAEKAKVGQSSNPETMDIRKYELENINIYDSPGLGDGKEADIRHAKNIISKLYEKDDKNQLLIDLVLVIIDGSTRDLGTSFELINSVICPNIGEDKKRLLVAINQADMAMKGRGWNNETNKPDDTLLKFLDDKALSVKNRIKESTGIDVDPIYYCAGYKDGDQNQNPYNLAKLLLYIINNTKSNKRLVFLNDINQNKEMWADNDDLIDYKEEIKKTLVQSITENMSIGSEIGSDIGEGIGRALGGSTGAAAGKFVGKVVGGVGGVVVGLIKGIFG